MASSAQAAAAPSAFTSLAPYRLLDTRYGVGAAKVAVAKGCKQLPVVCTLESSTEL